MKAAIYARMSTDKQSGDSPAAPADPRIRAFLDALAEAVADAVLREIRDEQAPRKG